MGLMLGSAGCFSNLIVYLIQEFNMKSVDAPLYHISNVINDCTSLFPTAGTIVPDSIFGCFSVIAFSSLASQLGIILLKLTATVDSLKPSEGETPSMFQLEVLYSGLTLASIAVGGTRFTIATIGAAQFAKTKDQGVILNWFFVTTYVASVISATAIVYIQDNIGWGWGFGICVGTNAIGLAVSLAGKRYHRLMVFSQTQSSHYSYSCAKTQISKLPSSALSLSLYISLIFLNRAALKTEGDIRSDGSVAKPWRLCTVEQISLTVLQALTMDRYVGPHFQIPAGSFLIFSLLSTTIAISVADRLLSSTWTKLTSRSPTPLQHVGLGHVLNIMNMAGSALDQTGSTVVPMSALWLEAPLAIVGVGEAFHFSGQVSLYYQEFSVHLRSTTTAMVSLLIAGAIGFYMSTTVIDLVRRITGWLPDNINQGRMDNMF
ncbi:hypothetical protein NE237_008740 [Protea cynaroides]|uniref:Uncharacterized protein n=1 Tax=Protea cynaroides TaxID=273540 RepID=A0A9Q0KWE3_9MAGN|nr:hypothetical protein NE237_008740 [Protea cynaroides]